MKKILLTGGSGFFGRNIIPFIKKKHFVKTLGISNHDDYQTDLGSKVPLLTDDYDLIIHAAGKAHSVPRNLKESQEFFNINTQGIKNLCKALELRRTKAFIFISSVAVYGEVNGENITEAQSLKGESPYALSKIQAEEFLLDWGSKNGVEITILRLPLLVGKNPPGNLGSMISAIKKGYYFRIGDGSARRSMVLAVDVAQLIASNQIRAGIYNLTDGFHPTFNELELTIAKQCNKKIRSLPFCLIKFTCKIGDHIKMMPINSYKFEKLTSTLTFSDNKAREEMNWNPKSVIEVFQI